MFKQILKQIAFILLLISHAYANNNPVSDNIWDEIRFHGLQPGKKYSISIGSGFFVNSNMIVTNRHVVENCRNIAIRGAVSPTLATLHLIDEELDLALIKSPIAANKVPYLRNNFAEIKKDDILFSIGYPLKHGESGVYVIKQAKVINSRTDPKYGFVQIEFTDTVDHGNSGGPLLDKNSNLVGVVTAKLTYKYQDHTAKTSEKIVSMAIGVDGLIEFLKESGTPYAASSTYDIFTNYHLDRLVKDYVVNIHCVAD